MHCWFYFFDSYPGNSKQTHACTFTANLNIHQIHISCNPLLPFPIHFIVWIHELGRHLTYLMVKHLIPLWIIQIQGITQYFSYIYFLQTISTRERWHMVRLGDTGWCFQVANGERGNMEKGRKHELPFYEYSLAVLGFCWSQNKIPDIVSPWRDYWVCRLLSGLSG